jgi:membrane fusion protein (multidrug efflux system)
MGDKWVVSKGLQAGDKVILEGILKVQPGAEVKAVEEGAANTAPAAAPSPVSDTQTSPTQPAK